MDNSVKVGIEIRLCKETWGIMAASTRKLSHNRGALLISAYQCPNWNSDNLTRPAGPHSHRLSISQLCILGHPAGTTLMDFSMPYVVQSTYVCCDSVASILPNIQNFPYLGSDLMS